MVNEFYTKNLQAVKQELQKEQEFPHVALYDFLMPKELEEIKKQLKEIKIVQTYKPLSHSWHSSPIKLPLSLEDYLFTLIGKEFKFQYIIMQHKDYYLRHHQNKEEYIVLFDLTEKWDQKAGGSFICITENGETYTFQPRFNSLIIIKKPKNIDYFVEYLNHYATKRKLLLGKTS